MSNVDVHIGRTKTIHSVKKQLVKKLQMTYNIFTNTI